MHIARSSIPSNIIHRISFSVTQASLRLPSFHHFPFHPSIFNYLQANDIHTPTYCQYGLFSALAKEKDRVYHLTAPTGSGKTLAYLLPMASQLKKDEEGGGALTASQRPRAIVLTASKELVLQGKQVGKQIAHHCKLKVEGLGIGRSLIQENKTIVDGVDILLSTYSRLFMQIQKKNLYLSNLKWLVIDQTDTLFETGKIDKIFEQFISRTKNISDGPRILMTGTTSPPELRTFLQKYFKQYTEVVDKRTHMNLENIKHEFVQCQELDKHQTLLDVLYQRRQAKTMIFCSTVKSLHELQYLLESQGINALTLHSQLHKNARLQNYQLFRDGQNNIMMSTDLGARGLDIPNLERVINYDFPLSTVDYLQRAGRTGRAGQAGQVVTLYHKKNMKVINQLKDASFNIPLRVSNSAYGMRNRQFKHGKS